MPLQLRSTYLSIFTHIVIFTVYAWCVFSVFGLAYFTGPEALVRIGRALIVLIVAGYAFDLVVQLTVFIVSSKILKNSNNFFMIDERDKQIEYRSLSYSYHVLTVGIFLSIGALALGWDLFLVFNLIVLTFALAYLMEFSTKLILYKRGI